MLTETYRIHLPQFEGPFDLLLFFIERDELDIYDIPITKITNDFLDYLHHIDKIKVEIASEFILMASKLMKIKAAMLLPRPELNEKGEIIDPRMELIDRIVEYKTFKEATKFLDNLENEARERFKRGFVKAEAQLISETNTNPDGSELKGVTLLQILKIYNQVLVRFADKQSRPKHVVQKFPYTPEEVANDIKSLLIGRTKLDFLTFVQACPDRLYLVFSFLCLLEMLQQNILKVVIAEGFNNFWIMNIETKEIEN